MKKTKKIAKRLRARADELVARAVVLRSDEPSSKRLVHFAGSEQTADAVHERAVLDAIHARAAYDAELKADVLREVADQLAPLPKKKSKTKLLKQAVKERKAAKKAARAAQAAPSTARTSQNGSASASAAHG